MSDHTAIDAGAGGHTVEIDRILHHEWDAELSNFADANPYQSWSYGLAHFRRWGLSHLIVRDGRRPIGMAQVCVLRFPCTRAGWAYVAQGPVWRTKGSEIDLAAFRAVVIALRDEFAHRHGLYLRLTPNLFQEDVPEAVDILHACGYRHTPGRYRTLLLDLRPPLDELRAGLRPNWRKSLKQAEGAGIELIEGDSVSLFDEALAVHREMHVRKGYAEFVNMEEFRVMQEYLPDALKMHIVLCRYQGSIVSAIGWSVYGDIGIPLIGATRPAALKIGASNLMYWRMVEWFKEHGFRYCDLAGINPERNPGSYIFKTGLARRHGREAASLGEFHYCRNPASKIAYGAVQGVKHAVTRARLASERLRGRIGRLERTRVIRSSSQSPSQETLHA